MESVSWGTASSTSANLQKTQISEDVLNRNTCTQIQNSLAQTTNPNTFLQSYRLDPTQMTANQNLLANLRGFKQQLEIVPPDQRGITQISTKSPGFDSYISKLESYIRFMTFTDDCLQSASKANVQAMDTQQEKTDESKLRYDSLQTPEQRVSFYEGSWILTRPLSETGLFVLFGLALLFLFYSAALFLRMSGIQLDIQFPALVMGSTYGVSFLEGSGPFVIGFVLGIVAAIVYYFLKR